VGGKKGTEETIPQRACKGERGGDKGLKKLIGVEGKKEENATRGSKNPGQDRRKKGGKPPAKGERFPEFKRLTRDRYSRIKRRSREDNDTGKNLQEPEVVCREASKVKRILTGGG